MDDFYVTLQSDSSSTHFPNNCITSFKNYFPEPIRLEHEKFEVALVECSYVHQDYILQHDGWTQQITTSGGGVSATKTRTFAGNPKKMETLQQVVQLVSDDTVHVGLLGTLATFIKKPANTFVRFNEEIT